MVWFSADTPTGGEPTGDCTGTRNSQTMEIRPALLDIDFTYEDFSKLNPLAVQQQLTILETVSGSAIHARVPRPMFSSMKL